MTKYLLLFAVVFSFSCKNETKNTEQNSKNEQVSHDHNNGEAHNHKENESLEPKKIKILSPHTSAMAMIDDTHIHIDYSSPGVRNRIIFGGLLTYGEVWQAGAHNATWIETNKDLIIDDQELKAGKYGFFTIPGKETWTLIFNSRWKQHGKDEYNVEEDVLRVNVKPEKTEEVTEHLTYEVKETGNRKGNITLSWEKIKVTLPFQIKN